MESTTNRLSSTETVSAVEAADPSANEATQPAKEDVPEKKPGTLCGVCNTNPSKYKCPRCRLPYCSVPCNKIHRENHPPDPEPETKPIPSIPPSNTASFDIQNSTSTFDALENSGQLQYLFKKYPCLPNALRKIYTATQPPEETSLSKPAIPASLLKGLPPKKDTWNHDMGIKNGKDALRKARQADDEEGEAIREYSELVLHIMGKKEGHDGVQDSVRQQDTDLIRRLMEQDRR